MRSVIRYLQSYAIYIIQCVAYSENWIDTTAPQSVAAVRGSQLRGEGWCESKQKQKLPSRTRHRQSVFPITNRVDAAAGLFMSAAVTNFIYIHNVHNIYTAHDAGLKCPQMDRIVWRVDSRNRITVRCTAAAVNGIRPDT